MAMRTFRVVSKKGTLSNEYITEGEEYFLVSINQTVSFETVIPQPSGFHPGSYMDVSKFKLALRKGEIIFTD